MNVQHPLDERARPTQIESIDEGLAKFPVPLRIRKFDHRNKMKRF
ncbi:MAG: hypothetical protein PHH13_05445 [Candidatus Peribacteraceae bacterium]|nr:hypothetical protein [Candidatus Peribacteraceae bacterium]